MFYLTIGHISPSFGVVTLKGFACCNSN